MNINKIGQTQQKIAFQGQNTQRKTLHREPVQNASIWEACSPTSGCYAVPVCVSGGDDGGMIASKMKNAAKSILAKFIK